MRGLPGQVLLYAPELKHQTLARLHAPKEGAGFPASVKIRRGQDVTRVLGAYKKPISRLTISTHDGDFGLVFRGSGNQRVYDWRQLADDLEAEPILPAVEVVNFVGACAGASHLFDLERIRKSLRATRLCVETTARGVDAYDSDYGAQPVEELVGTASELDGPELTRSTQAVRIVLVGEAAKRESRFWAPLVRSAPPAWVATRLAYRDVRIQSLRQAGGRIVNLDFYPVKIARMPAMSSPQEPHVLLEHVRTHLNHFVDERSCLFRPFDEARDCQWFDRQDPTASLLTMDIEGSDDLEAVACSDASREQWTFSTVAPRSRRGSDAWGVRRFGFMTTGDHLIFYTMGAFRSARHNPYEGNEGLSLLRDDNVWRSFQERVAAYVDSRRGKAEVMQPFCKRYPWRYVDRVTRQLSDSQ